MNLPGTEEGNWRWRYSREQLTAGLARRLRELTGSANRDSMRTEVPGKGLNPQRPKRPHRF